MLGIERLQVVPHHDVSLVVPVPHGAQEALHAAIQPLGCEHHLPFVVPLGGGADGRRPHHHVVCVDAATDDVLPPAEIPALASDGQPPVLHGGNTGEPLNVEREYPHLLLSRRGDPFAYRFRQAHIGSHPRRRSLLMVEYPTWWPSSVRASAMV